MAHRPGNAYVHEIRVGWGDCDPAEIVYTARLPWFALDAIDAWWEDHLGHGWYQLELDRRIGMPFVRLEMDFVKPVSPRHRLKCYVWPVRIGETSIEFRVDGEQNQHMCFKTRTVSVFIKAKKFSKNPPPQDIRGLVETMIAEQ